MSHEQANSTEIVNLIPLKPTPDFRLRRPVLTDAITKEPDTSPLRVISHRLNLRPQEPKKVDDSLYSARSEETGFLYRKGVLSGEPKLVFGSYGHEEVQAIQVPTRWAVMHPFAAISFLTGHGEWWFARTAKPTSAPPERFNLKEVQHRIKTIGHRPVMAPTARQ